MTLVRTSELSAPVLLALLLRLPPALQRHVRRVGRRRLACNPGLESHFGHSCATSSGGDERGNGAIGVERHRGAPLPRTNARPRTASRRVPHVWSRFGGMERREHVVLDPMFQSAARRETRRQRGHGNQRPFEHDEHSRRVCIDVNPFRNLPCSTRAVNDGGGAALAGAR